MQKSAENSGHRNRRDKFLGIHISWRFIRFMWTMNKSASVSFIIPETLVSGIANWHLDVWISKQINLSAFRNHPQLADLYCFQWDGLKFSIPGSNYWHNLSFRGCHSKGLFYMVIWLDSQIIAWKFSTNTLMFWTSNASTTCSIHQYHYVYRFFKCLHLISLSFRNISNVSI